VTFRLADSLPQTKLDQLRAEKEAWLQVNPEPWSLDKQREHQSRFGERVQEWLDAGYGSCALSQPDVRQQVQACLLRFDGDELRLHAAVIMPTHVHALIEPLTKRVTGISAHGLDSNAQTGMSVPLSPGVTGIPAGALDFNPQTAMSVSSSLTQILRGIKGASARAANQLLGRTGTFWMDESYDRIVRNDAEYRAFVGYINDNPKKAGLTADQYWLHCPDLNEWRSVSVSRVSQAFLPVLS
jgi:REP element-mobilizing transposase RayT